MLGDWKPTGDRQSRQPKRMPMDEWLALEHAVCAGIGCLKKNDLGLHPFYLGPDRVHSPIRVPDIVTENTEERDLTARRRNEGQFQSHQRKENQPETKKLGDNQI